MPNRNAVRTSEVRSYLDPMGLYLHSLDRAKRSCSIWGHGTRESLGQTQGQVNRFLYARDVKLPWFGEEAMTHSHIRPLASRGRET